jgi:DNA-binding winged helix-turn-helix (wHTH) protein
MNLEAVNASSTSDDPLVAAVIDPYPWSVSPKRWWTRYRTLFALATVVVVLSAVATTLFTHSYLGVLHDAFRERSVSYVQAFAAAAQPWRTQADVGMLRSAAHLLLAGSAIYVQMADETGFLIDERTGAAQDLPLEVESEIFTASLSQTVRSTGGSHLDILVPLSAADGAGYVRVGIDRAAVMAQSNGTIVIASGAAIGFDIVILLILAVAARGRRREERPSATLGEAIAGEKAIVTAGPIEVDLFRKSVRLGGVPVRLTPKQFALLRLLASQPERVFSEQEILEAAWSGAPYADSKDIKQYVYLVRRRLAEVDPGARSLIVTVPGFGYKLAVESVDSELTGT